MNESKVQNLSTWAMVVLLAAEGKVWGSCAWMEGEFHFGMLHLKRSYSFREEGKTEGKSCIYRVQLFLNLRKYQPSSKVVSTGG